MRKIAIIAAVAALGAFASSCVNEKTTEVELMDLGRVSFVLDDGSTRSDAVAPIKSFKYRLGTDEQGITYTLYESVMELDGVGYEAETRGTPAYTENVTKVFGSSFNGVAYGTRSGATEMSQIAGDDTFDEVYGKWRRDFGTNPWEFADPLTFFLRMPASPSGVTNLKYNSEGGVYTPGVLEFDYQVPTSGNNSAAVQQDILFAIRELSQSQYRTEASSAKGGASVLFRHALTGVKFAIGNHDAKVENGIETYITKVTISGLRSKGHAVFNPDNSVESTVDDIDVFSSKNSFTWTYDETSTGTYSQTYTADDIRDFAKDGSDQVGAPDSFYAAGEKNNLNKADASLTFWFIPQAITDDVTMSITFYTKDTKKNTTSSPMTLNLDLGTRIQAQEEDINKTWFAGQLRTFTLAPSTISVEVTDIVENKTTKKNLETRNTGNKDAWMRAAIVGNWVNTSGQIVAPWNDSQGTFVGLGGNGAWIEGGDGFWYFQYKVPAGGLPSTPLFTTYTKPSTTPSGAAGLQIDITVQVIDSGLGTNFADAWKAAKGGDDDGIPVPPGDDDDPDDGSGE